MELLVLSPPLTSQRHGHESEYGAVTISYALLFPIKKPVTVRDDRSSGTVLSFSCKGGKTRSLSVQKDMNPY